MPPCAENQIVKTYALTPDMENWKHKKEYVITGRGG